MINQGTVVASTLRPTSSDDKFPIVINNEGKGGVHSYQSLTERNQIPLQRRDWGMLCYVTQTNTTYQLIDSGSNNLTDNNQWKPFLGTSSIYNGGNSFASPITIGTNDNFDLNLETNDTNRVVISKDGDISLLPLAATNSLVQIDGDGKLSTVTKDTPLGIPALDNDGKIKLDQIPQSIKDGGLHYAGLWDANTNAPHLTSGTASGNSLYYIVSVSGTYSLNGVNDWQAGDWAVFSGNVWGKIDNTERFSGGGSYSTIPLWTGTTQLGNSIITQNGNSISVDGRVSGATGVSSNDFTTVNQLNNTFANAWQNGGNSFGGSFSTLGTKDNQLVIIANNIEAARFLTDGRLLLGTNTPFNTQKFQVSGQSYFSDTITIKSPSFTSNFGTIGWIGNSQFKIQGGPAGEMIIIGGGGGNQIYYQAGRHRFVNTSGGVSPIDCQEIDAIGISSAQSATGLSFVSSLNAANTGQAYWQTGFVFSTNVAPSAIIGTGSIIRITPTLNTGATNSIYKLIGLEYAPIITNTTGIATHVAFTNTVGDNIFNSLSGNTIVGTRLSIGATAPNADLVVSKDTARVAIVSPTGTAPIVSVGIAALAPAAGIRYGSYAFGIIGNDGTLTQYVSSIQAISEGNYTSTSHPTYLSLSTTATGSVTPVEAMRISSQQNLIIGTTSDRNQKLQVAGDAYITSSLQVGAYATSSLLVSKIHTSGQIAAGGGYSLVSPTIEDGNTQVGLYYASNTIRIKSAYDIIRFTQVNGSINGNVIQPVQTWNPSSGTGSVNLFEFSQVAVTPNGTNSVSYKFIHINPQIINNTFGSGAIYGVNFEPNVTSLNNVPVYAFRNTIGNNIFNETSGNTLIGTNSNTSNSKLKIVGSSSFYGGVTIESSTSSYYPLKVKNTLGTSLLVNPTITEIRNLLTPSNDGGGLIIHYGNTSSIATASVPLISAGDNFTLNNRSSIKLNGQSYDTATSQIYWSLVSAPVGAPSLNWNPTGAFGYDSVGSLTPTITGLTYGTYTFRLTMYYSFGGSGTSDVTISVTQSAATPQSVLVGFGKGVNTNKIVHGYWATYSNPVFVPYMQYTADGSLDVLTTLNVSGRVAGMTAINSNEFITLSQLNSSLSGLTSAVANAFVQGGNSFGATAILGTNDNQPLIIQGSQVKMLTDSGSGTFEFFSGYFHHAGNSNLYFDSDCNLYMNDSGSIQMLGNSSFSMYDNSHFYMASDANLQLYGNSNINTYNDTYVNLTDVSLNGYSTTMNLNSSYYYISNSHYEVNNGTYVLNGGDTQIYNSTLNLSDSTFKMNGASVSFDSVVATFSSRVSGLTAINNNEYITKGQLNSTAFINGGNAISGTAYFGNTSGSLAILIGTKPFINIGGTKTTWLGASGPVNSSLMDNIEMDINPTSGTLSVLSLNARGGASIKNIFNKTYAYAQTAWSNSIGSQLTITMNDANYTPLQPGGIVRIAGSLSNGLGLGLYLVSDFGPIVFTKNPQYGTGPQEYGRFATASGEFLLGTLATTGAKMTVNGSASFNGRVSGQNAILSSEFVTLSQLNSAISGLTGGGGGVGSQGFQGFQGVQGSAGSNGVQGVQGNSGVQGLQGFQGVQGNAGSNGVQGNNGSNGTQGFQGYQGSIGSNGVQGVQGNSGLQGFQGFQGFQGNAGSNGVQGFQGFQGVQGNIGFQGNVGSNGTQGYQGLQGATGSGIAGIIIENGDNMVSYVNDNVVTLDVYTTVNISSLSSTDAVNLDRCIEQYYIYDKSGSAYTSATINLPTAQTGDVLWIYTGGTLKSSGTIISSWIINTAGTDIILGTVPTTVSVGDMFKLFYANGVWYIHKP